MRNFITALFLLSSFAIFSQTRLAVDAGYKVYYQQASFETDDYKIYIEDGISTEAWAKCKIRIFNKTNDFLIFKPTDLTFKIGDNVLPGMDKQVIVFPNDEATRVVDVKNKNSQYDKITIEIKNLYRVPANTPVIKTEDFNIPPTVKEFKTGDFTCTLKSAAIKTDKTLLKFVCAYEGDNIGILMPSQIVAQMPNKQENPNNNRNKGNLLEKGKSDDFFVEFKELKGAGDMQREPFKLIWNGTFKESKSEVIGGGKATIEVDNVKSAEKNK